MSDGEIYVHLIIRYRLKMTDELTRKRLESSVKPLLYYFLEVSHETEVGHAASGCCVSVNMTWKYLSCHSVSFFDSLSSPPSDISLYNFSQFSLLYSSALSFFPFEELMAGSWVVIQSQTGCSNHRLLIGFIILPRDLRWEKISWSRSTALP